MKMTNEQKAEIAFIKNGLRVSKVVVTRALKTKNGDFFLGMSAAWDTTQEDAGGMGADLIDALGEGEQDLAIIQRGMDLRKAKLAGLILAMRVDLQAVGHTMCGGGISQADHDNACRAIKRNYGKMMSEAVQSKNGGNGGGEG